MLTGVRRSSGRLLAVLASFSCAVYLNTLGARFTYDDYPAAVRRGMALMPPPLPPLLGRRRPRCRRRSQHTGRRLLPRCGTVTSQTPASLYQPSGTTTFGAQVTDGGAPERQTRASAPRRRPTAWEGPSRIHHTACTPPDPQGRGHQQQQQPQVVPAPHSPSLQATASPQHSAVWRYAPRRLTHAFTWSC